MIPHPIENRRLESPSAVLAAAVDSPPSSENVGFAAERINKATISQGIQAINPPTAEQASQNPAIEPQSQTPGPPTDSQSAADLLSVVEQIKNSNPVIIQASQTGDRINAEIRALDCSEKDGSCGFAIEGESKYQPMLRRIAKQGRSFRAVLTPEPDNPYDPNAIAVWAEGGGPIGYLSRANAVEYREVFALLTQHRHVGLCRARLIGGTPGKRTLGVLIDLRETESLLTDIRDTLAPRTPVSDTVSPF